MSEPITKPRVSAAAKIVLVLAAAAVLLAVFALAAPGSKFFFPLVSLWCNLALFAKFHTLQYNNSPGHCPAPRRRKMQNVPPLSKQTGHFCINITYRKLPQRS